MEIFLLIILFLSPVIGVFAGLSMAVTVPLFTLGLIIHLKKSLEFNVRNYKLEGIFILWILASAIWSLNPINSLLSGVKFSTEFLIGLVLIQNIVKLDISKTKIEKIIIISLFLALIGFAFQYLTHGKVSILFKEFTQKKESHVFFLHSLDRGMSLITLLSWLVIGIFVKNTKYLLGFVVYCATLIALVFSDSLASLVGHLVAGLVYMMTRFTFLKNPKILCFLLIIVSVIMIMFAFHVNALEVALENNILPLSAKHRLFIWNFVAENSRENSILGIGFNSSRIFPVSDNQIVSILDSKLHPLPLHPHNNIMQIYFEIGIVGLIIYLSLLSKYIMVIGRKYLTTDTQEKNMISAGYACFSAYFIISMISYNMWQSWFVESAIFIFALFALNQVNNPALKSNR